MWGIQSDKDIMPLDSGYMDSPFQYAPSDIGELNFMKWEENFYDNDIWKSPVFGNVGITTSVKNTVFSTIDNATSADHWREIPVCQWSSHDTVHWVTSVLQENNIKSVNVANFIIDGASIINMTEEYFLSLAPQHGRILFEALKMKLFEDSLLPPYISEKNEEEQRHLLDISPSRIPTDNHQYSDYTDLKPKCSPTQRRQKPGRPKKESCRDKRNKENKKLWEFLIDLLHNEKYCPSLICWEDYNNGVFKFKCSETVAKLWGSRKDNDKMTYEKLSRAMRYYYKSEVLLPVLGKRLVYKFGPTARGWKTDNPIIS